MYLQRRLVPVHLLAVLVLLVTLACRKKIDTPAPAPPMAHQPENSYLDLAPGNRLRVILPVGDTLKAVQQGSSSGREHGTQTISAGVVGYRTVYFRVVGPQRGRVHLSFESSATSTNGTTVRDSGRPRLPFQLPDGRGYLRLLYLVRQSSADHNMAVVLARNATALATFTERFNTDPNVCREKGEDVVCTWIPSGVGLRTVSEAEAAPGH